VRENSVMQERRRAAVERRRGRRAPFVAAVKHKVGSDVQLALAQNLGPTGIELKRPAGPAYLPRTPVSQLSDRVAAMTQQLTALQQLQSVNIVGTAVTAAGLLALKNIPGLRSIYFYRTAVKAADWAALKKAFPAATLDSGGYRVPLFETDTMLVKPPKKEQ